MSLKSQRIFLWTLGTMILIVAAAVAIDSIWAPYELGVVGASASPTTRQMQASLQAEPTLAALQSAARMDLRRPLFDPPPPAPIVAAPPPAPPPLTVRLAGTIIEPGHDRAVLIGPDGKTELKAVGETSGPAEVMEIGTNSCVVRYLGNPVTLKIDRPGGQGTGG